MKKGNKIVLYVICGIIAIIFLILIILFINKKQDNNTEVINQSQDNNYTVKGYDGPYDGEDHGINITIDDGTIMYGTVSGEYTQTESPTRKDIGTTTVYYQIKIPGKDDITGSEDIVITPISNQLTLSETKNNYSFSSSFTFEVIENLSGGVLTCESDNEKIATCSITGTKVTVKSEKETGTVNITIKSSANGNYSEGSAVYTAVIEEGTNSYKSSGYNKKYDGKEHGITVTSEGSIIKYGTEEGTYDKDKSPTRKDVGTTIVYYQITKSGYKTIYGKENIVISKASGKATISSTFDIGTDETKKIEVSDATGQISCKSENSSIATCSVSNNIVTIKGAKIGTTKLNIKIASSNNYNEVTKTININTVLKCKFNGNLTQGAEYTNGQYTYRYKQEGDYSNSSLAWTNISEDGWGVQLTDKTSTNAVTSNLCAYINDKPVVSMGHMFFYSKATTLNLSSFNTSKVTNMEAMFEGSKATTLNLSSFNTSKVKNMSWMFYNSAATTLDLSNFNTSNVTDMSGMFDSSSATKIKGLEKFNTSKVTNMSYMFYGCAATTLNLSSFNTSKVTSMRSMFDKNKATTLDLSSFNTSNVTDMRWMFNQSAATEIKGLKKFNTSKVTNMDGMFCKSKAITLDLSSFNTSNVIGMSYMFDSSSATELNLSSFNTSKVTDMCWMFSESVATEIKGLEKFNTCKVTNMKAMFQKSKVATLNLSSFDTSKVTDMSYMFYNSAATTGYARNNEEATKFNATSNKPSTLVFTVK